MSKDIPAFPKTPFIEIGTPQNGMTLRDYFAAKAMQGLCAREDGKGFDFLTFPNDPMRVAHWAYDVADAMLKAREQ